MASSPLVFKVKYETRLKRFCASVVDKKLDLDLAKLKDKIYRLFSLFSIFGSHADQLAMTYVDEDGDEVCLDTDDELQEAVRQNLNPVRITIKLKPDSRYSPAFGLPFGGLGRGSFGSSSTKSCFN